MPTAPARAAAARSNGAKSTGPRTAQGKLASARNSITHGLTARTVILDTESQAAYEADLSTYLDHFRPETKPETDLVHQIAAAHWRLARYLAVESALLDHTMDDQADRLAERYDDLPDNRRLALAFEALAQTNGAFSLLNRYQARLQREYHQLLKTLTQLQTARLAAELAASQKQELQNEARIAPPPVIDTNDPFNAAAS